MPFPTNPLEAALVGARAGIVPANQLLDAIAGNILWVPLPAGAGPQGQAQLPVLLLGGQPFVAAYTSAEQFAVGAGESARMELPGKQLAGLMADELGLAINPGAEHGVPVNPEGVRALRGGSKTVRSGARLRLGLPEPEPQELLTALASVFAAAPAVVEARRALAQIDEQPPALLIGVRPDRSAANWQGDILAAVDTAVSQAPLSYPLDTVWLDDGKDPVTRWMLENAMPFYSREAGTAGA